MIRFLALLVTLALVLGALPASARKRRTAQSATDQTTPPRAGVSVHPLTSSHIAVSWATDTPAYAQVEYSLTPFKSEAPEGMLFPTSSLSATYYTRVPARTHDLCPTSLQPDTLYYVRARSKDQQGVVMVSPTFSVRTLAPPAPVPRSEFATQDWLGLYATDQWMGNPRMRANLMRASYIRGMAISDRWSNVEPAPGQFNWSILDTAVSEAERGGKYMKMALRSASKVTGKRIPDWVPEGVEIIPGRDEGDHKAVKWDPVFACRWWQYVVTYGRRYDARLRGKLSFVGVSGAGSGEMTTRARTLDNYRRLGYSDQQIETNMLWVWQNLLHVFAEAFPQARLSIVPGSIPLVGRKKAVQRDLGAEVVRAAVETYGRRLVISHSGFATQKEGFLITTQQTYRQRVWIGGLTEQPTQDKIDPVAVLRQLFEEVVFPLGFAYVTLHSDGLGINPNRWGDLQPLQDYLQEVEKRFARMRATE